jgi:hypothetical protein
LKELWSKVRILLPGCELLLLDLHQSTLLESCSPGCRISSIRHVKLLKSNLVHYHHE